MSSNISLEEQLRAENAALHARLEEAEDTLRAIRSGEVDSLVVETAHGSQIFSLDAAEAGSNRLRGDILAQVSDAVGMIDNNDRITYLNPACERLYRVQPGEMLGRKVGELYQRRWLKPGDEAVAMAALREQGEARWELIHITHDGRELHVQSSVCQMRDSTGKVTGIIAGIRDVTERKQAEVALAKSEEELRDFVENASVGMHWVGADGIILWANRTELQLLGYSREEYIGHHIAGFHADEPVIQDILGRLTQDETLDNYEARLRCKDGSVRNVLINSNVLRENGKFVHTRCFTRDITERKRAEEMLRASEAEFRAVFEQSAVGKAQLDARTGHFVRVNAKFCEMIGYSADELAGMTPMDITFADDRDTDAQALGQMLREEQDFYELEKRYVRKDGQIIWVHVNATLLRDAEGRPRRTVAAIQDITARKQAEEALRESEHFLQRITDVTPGVLHVFDLEKQCSTFINRTVASVVGYTAEEITAMGASILPTLMHPDDFARFPGHLERVRALRDDETADFEFRIRNRAGEWHWFHADDAVFARDAAGVVTQLIGTAIEITARKQAEVAVRASEDRYRATFASAPVGIAHVGLDGRWLRFNDALCTITGYSREQLATLTFADITHPDDLEADWAQARRVLAGEIASYSMEKRYLRADGRVVWVNLTVSLLRDAESAPVNFISVVEDISERRKANLELANREAHLRRVINNQLGLVGIIDREGILLEVDERSLAIAKTRREQVIGKHFADAPWWNYDPAVAAQMRDAMRRAFAGEVVRYDVSLFAHGAEGVMITFMIAPVFGADGEVEYLIPSGVDIRERYAAEQELRSSEEFNRTVLESSPDCVKVLDAEGRLQFMNSNGMCAMEIDDLGPFRNQPWWNLWGEENTETIKQAVATALQTGTAHFQASCATAKGTMKWWDVVVGKVEGSNPPRLVSVSRDLTERRQAEEELRESEQRFRQTLMNVSVPTLLHADDDTILLVNQAWTDITGYRIEDIPTIGDWTRKAYGERHSTVKNFIDTLFDSDIRLDNGEFNITTASGEKRVWHFSTMPVGREPSGRRLIVSTAIDITEQKQATDDLRDSEERFRVLATAMPQLVWTCFSEGECSFLGPQWEAATGQSCADALGYGWLEMIHPDDRERTGELWQKAVAEARTYESEYRLRTQAGTYRWFLARAEVVKDAVGTVQRWIGTSTDIEDAKRTAAIVKASEQRMRLATEATKVAIWEWNVARDEVHWDAVMFQIYGMAPTASGFVPYRDWSETVLPEDLPEQERVLQDTVRRAGSSRREFRIRRQCDGEIRHVEAVETVRTNDRGETEWVVGTNLDVTDRKRAESAVAESQRKLQLGIDVAAFAIAEIDYVAQTIELSPDAARLFSLGDAATTVPRQQIHDLFHPDDRDRIHAAINDCFAAEGSHQIAIEHRIVLPDGTTRWLDIRKRIHFDESTSPPRPIRSTMAARDITEQKESADRIRQGEERLRLAMNAAQLSLWEWDVVNDQISWAKELHNQQSMERITPIGGFDDFLDMVHVDDRKSVRGAIHESLSEGNPYHCEFRMRRSDGSYRWVLSMAHLSIDGNNAPVRMVGVEMDITDRKENELSLRLSAERLAVAADAAGFGMLHVDLKLQTVTYSPEMKRIIGWRDDQSVPLKPGELLEFVHPDDQDRCATHYERAMLKDSPKSRSIDHRIISTDGMTRWVRLQTKTLFSEQTGEAAQIIGTVLDITQQRNFEEQLKATRDAAEAANQSKSAFVANMSHEIRTPMTAILGYADLLREDVTSEQARQHLGTIQRNGAYLLEIINDILDLSKIEAGKLDIESERFQPARVIEDVRSIMEVRAKDGGLSLDVAYDGKLPKIIQSDAKRLKQILINLVGNAIKFTREGSVKIRVRYEQQDRRLSFDVVDTGIGISAEQQARLFKPFSQGDASVTRNFGGTGLGLAISKRLAEMLGGKITASSTVNVGSTFTVSISTGDLKDIELVDYAAAGDQPTLELKPVDSDPAKLACHVLIVDDRRDIRLLAKLLLTKAGATIDECEDGLLAVEHVTDCLEKDNCPDLILLDMQMPNLDGYQTARKLREIGYIGPIIALTADAMQGDMNECIEAGCNGYLSKPIDAVRLVQVVKQLTEARK